MGKSLFQEYMGNPPENTPTLTKEYLEGLLSSVFDKRRPFQDDTPLVPAYLTVPVEDLWFDFKDATNADIDARVEERYKDLPEGSYQIGDPSTFMATTGRGGYILYKKEFYKQLRDALSNG